MAKKVKESLVNFKIEILSNLRTIWTFKKTMFNIHRKIKKLLKIEDTKLKKKKKIKNQTGKYSYS